MPTAVFEYSARRGTPGLNVSLVSRDMGWTENFDIRENRGILTPDGRQIDLLCRNEIHSCSVHARKRNPLSDGFVKKTRVVRAHRELKESSGGTHTVSIEFCGSCVRASLRLALHFPLLLTAMTRIATQMVATYKITLDPRKTDCVKGSSRRKER
ncbi:hypothetical protein ALC56_02769 [Trachymyrmex septentrionalis]|uniref:Uncharacterized protein n=1 Tax=Trachymyrmex septentrionalis TaxID=34720 RepID=A0A195FST3_9HYME|nr:hypothetical protein ALC56_02769 [Trachymyrmex septentrionalis]